MIAFEDGKCELNFSETSIGKKQYQITVWSAKSNGAFRPKRIEVVLAKFVPMFQLPSMREDVIDATVERQETDPNLRPVYIPD